MEPEQFFFGDVGSAGQILDLLRGGRQTYDEIVADLKMRDGDKRSNPASRRPFGSISWTSATLNPNLFQGATDIGNAMFGPSFATNTTNSAFTLVDLNTTDDKKTFEQLTIVGLAVDVTIAGHATIGGVGAPYEGRYLEQLGDAILNAYQIGVFPTASDTNPYLGWTDLRALYSPESELHYGPMIPCYCTGNSARVVIRTNPNNGLLGLPLPPVAGATDSGVLAAFLSVYFKTAKLPPPTNF